VLTNLILSANNESISRVRNYNKIQEHIHKDNSKSSDRPYKESFTQAKPSLIGSNRLSSDSSMFKYLIFYSKYRPYKIK